MSALKSSVLILGPESKKSKDFGADFFHTFQELQNYLSSTKAEYGPSLLILDFHALDTKTVSQWLIETKKLWPRMQVILIVKSHSGAELKSLINTDTIFKILPSFDDPYYELSVQEALATADLYQQTALLVQLAEEQNKKLLNLQKELESRVEKRQQNLTESREKLIRSHRRTESFHRAIVAIQQSKTIKQIEQFVAEALHPGLQIEGVHISFLSTKQSQTAHPNKGFCTVPLTSDGINVGYVTFMRAEVFSDSEQSFLDQLSSAIALAIDRLAKFEQAEILKQQWDSTFNAITEPVAIIDSDYNVIRTNNTFLEFSLVKTVPGEKCYKSLFGRSQPCEGCQLGARFELSTAKTQDGQQRTFSVSSQKYEDQDLNAYINIYNDMTEKKQLEKRILESAKLAELGTVGGSIAHELNNPIAGMLTFTQLIRMDLKSDEWYFEDIVEIEKGILRCRDIIQNLLSSIRKLS